MTEAVTLNQARLHLGVGKEKLKRLLTETGIVPIQINRQRKEVSLEQLEQLQQLLNNDPATSGLDSGQPVKTTGRPDKPTSQDYRSTGQPSPIDFEATIELALTKERLEAAQKEISQLVNQLQSTETKLENQLQEAKEERLAERREREGYQEFGTILTAQNAACVCSNPKERTLGEAEGTRMAEYELIAQHQNYIDSGQCQEAQVIG